MLTFDALKIKQNTVVMHYWVWFDFQCIRRYFTRLYNIPNEKANSATAGQKCTTYQPTDLYQFPTLKKRTLFITNLSAKFIILVMTTYVRGMLLLLCTRRKRVWKLKIASKVHRKCTGHKDSSRGLMYQKIKNVESQFWL